MDEVNETPLQWDAIIVHSCFKAELDPEDQQNLNLTDKWLTPQELIERQQDQEQKQHRHLRMDTAFKREEPKETESAMVPSTMVEAEPQEEKTTVDVQLKGIGC